MAGMSGSLLLRILYRFVPRSYYERAAIKLEKVPGRKVLDIGSGAGHLMGLLRRKEVIGLDVDIGLLKMASGDRVLGSAHSSPFMDSCFDLVIFHDSLHHLEDPSKGIGEARRVLKAGGLLAIFDFDRSSFPVKFLMIFEKLAGFPATFLTLRELLNLPGLRVVTHEREDRGYFFLLLKKD